MPLTLPPKPAAPLTDDQIPTRPSASDSARLLVTHADRPLVYAGLAFLALVPVSVVLAFIDSRTVDGSNLWFKPLKFQASMAIYLFTLALMAPLAGAAFRRGWIGRATVWLAISMGVFEVGWITLRAGLGLRSHYAESAFGNAMYLAMGVGAVILSLTCVVLAAGALFGSQRLRTLGNVRFGVAFGAAVAVVGAIGIGGMLGDSNAHYPVDADDAANRIPVIGWSLDRGDLRIAHFIGLHALQGLFALGLLLVRTPPAKAIPLFAVAALAWLTGVLWLATLANGGRSPFVVFLG
ncbi:MAG: hypothetical protein AAGI68_10875 [Planctomycetota bacterium]